MTMALLPWLSCLLLCFSPRCAGAAEPPRRVAIVGAGLGGGSACHFLRQLLGDQVEIVVYEASQEPGGRTLTRRFANLTVDVGGTAIYSKNKYVSSFASQFNLTRAGDDGTNGVIGIWDGSQLRIALDTDRSWLAGAKAVLRYGFSPLRVIPAVRKTVDLFDQIYDLQDRNRSFSSPQEMLTALKLFNLTQIAAYDYFADLGVNERFTKELVDGASRCNYNQAGTLNGFTDLISLAGAGVAGHVFSLENGTQAISKALLRSADRLHLNERVAEIRADERGYFIISRGTQERKEHFDGVIVATPLELSNIKLPEGTQKHAGHGRQYQSTYVTFVHGMLNMSYFGRAEVATVTSLPAQLLTPEDASSPFTSFSIHKIFSDGSVVVKMFSRWELTEVVVERIFVKVFEVFRHTWKAYPKLQPLAPEQWASFRLDDRSLLYTSGLETSSSAMEVAAIAGRNAALLMQEALKHQAAPVRGHDSESVSV